MTNQQVLTATLLAVVVHAPQLSAQGPFEMRPRPTDPKDYPEYIQYLVDVHFPRTADERAADAPYRRVTRGKTWISSAHPGLITNLYMVFPSSSMLKPICPVTRPARPAQPHDSSRAAPSARHV